MPAKMSQIVPWILAAVWTTLLLSKHQTQAVLLPTDGLEVDEWPLVPEGEKRLFLHGGKRLYESNGDDKRLFLHGSGKRVDPDSFFSLVMSNRPKEGVVKALDGDSRERNLEWLHGRALPTHARLIKREFLHGRLGRR
ncbi:uncharacterized protein LOC106162439 [Lingula anatina]|uniref:Uncharacterized protein LOC106162439 n=1 Tax=Lingula anatina TaxID=7574 RepID=A0A1S3IAJ6_LINAN|nr:uncharacterized protein LOC106162439 [Lingula anatina]XP_013395189.1 uncharacterized protein LOC106162439 [Lingula anatina]|eukprot:XP_013395188.1 uncharacterized protein LOC106162439 [Lingula anatina]